MNRDDFFKLLTSGQWSNAACMGYVIKACKSLEYSDKEISALLQALNMMFSNFTFEEAEEEYRSY
ncbi:hypothetical protein SAMN02910436_02668 [Ruminococcaceae bacterium P7]|nr:hypothetical protein SAMN02910436_02668 [Ruminococcaceae bacterium P7]